MAELFDKSFPAITEWINSYGWIEIGSDEYSDSMIRALNEGGTVWESEKKYKTLDAALQDLEKELLKWMP